MPKIAVGDIEITCEVRGSGPPLLMIHGGEGDRNSDDHFIPRLQDLFTVITYDQRDAGDSGGTDHNYGMLQHAHDAAGVLSALGYERAFVYGQSYGGIIAQAFALAYPDKVSRLILSVSSPGKRMRHERASEVNDFLDAYFSDAPLPPPLSPAMFFSPGAFERRPELGKFLERPKVAVQDPEQFRRRMLAMEEFDSLDELPNIRMPTLVISGWGDQIANPVCSWTLAKGIPNARLVVLESAGHALTWEVPELMAPIIRGFLSE